MIKPSALEQFEAHAAAVDQAHAVLMKALREVAPHVEGPEISEQAHNTSLGLLRQCIREDLAEPDARSALLSSIMTCFYASASILEGFDEAMPKAPAVPATYEFAAFVVTKSYYVATARMLRHASLCLAPYSAGKPN